MSTTFVTVKNCCIVVQDSLISISAKMSRRGIETLVLAARIGKESKTQHKGFNSSRSTNFGRKQAGTLIRLII